MVVEVLEPQSDGDQFGGWIARAKSGNVYSEGTGGFTKPIKEFSPAVKIRSSHGLVAAQRPDGSWVARGPDNDITREMAEKINSMGVAPDLDMHFSRGYMKIIVWLEPRP